MIAASLLWFGEGRDCQVISAAARLITSIPRTSANPRGRNSIGSNLAAAASSSTKLSTAKQLAGLPGERIGAVQIALPGARTYHSPSSPSNVYRRKVRLSDVGAGASMMKNAAFLQSLDHLRLPQPSRTKLHHEAI
jgi:hypothetical protein